MVVTIPRDGNYFKDPQTMGKSILFPDAIVSRWQSIVTLRKGPLDIISCKLILDFSFPPYPSKVIYNETRWPTERINKEQSVDIMK